MAGIDRQDFKIADFFAALDVDGDGTIDKDEWLSFFGKMFDSVIDRGLKDLEWRAEQAIDELTY